MNMCSGAFGIHIKCKKVKKTLALTNSVMQLLCYCKGGGFVKSR